MEQQYTLEFQVAAVISELGYAANPAEGFSGANSIERATNALNYVYY